jgi:hypothetical protein
MYSPTAYYIA